MRVLWLVGWVSLMLAGCATPTTAPQSLLDNSAITGSSPQPEWQGRISVQVQGDHPTSMSASFLLRGDPKNGTLNLYSPLGTTLGALQWTSQWVQLNDGANPQYFNSLAELTDKVTGAALPVEAIFGWLQGQQTQAPGWLADLSAASQGSLSARRIAPAPEVMLRIKLDQ